MVLKRPRLERAAAKRCSHLVLGYSKSHSVKIGEQAREWSRRLLIEFSFEIFFFSFDPHSPLHLQISNSLENSSRTMSSPAPHHESPDSSSTPTFSLLDSWNRRFSNTKSNSEEEHGAQFASVKESEEGGTPTLQSPPGRRISKNYDVRRSLVEVSNNLRRPINYAYFSAVTIHVVLLLFAVICLAVRGDEKGFKTHIHTENLGVFQSGLNAMVSLSPFLDLIDRICTLLRLSTSRLDRCFWGRNHKLASCFS